MGQTELVIIAMLFAVTAFFCLGWMLWNLIAVMRNQGLSGAFGERMAQTKQILLKPALVFFAVGGFASAYLLLRNGSPSP